jgi:hypothetical protein
MVAEFATMNGAITLPSGTNAVGMRKICQGIRADDLGVEEKELLKRRQELYP